MGRVCQAGRRLYKGLEMRGGKRKRGSEGGDPRRLERGRQGSGQAAMEALLGEQWEPREGARDTIPLHISQSPGLNR